MAESWLDVFDDCATKAVSKTDKKKGAYVVNAKQKAIIFSTGIAPTDGPSERVLQIEVLGSNSGTLSVSYYNSLREGAGRTPETRMGKEIVGWVEIGDLLTIGRIGDQLFFSKEKQDASSPLADELGHQMAKSVDPKKLLAKAKRRTGPPPKRQRTINDFVRDPYVVAAALVRASGRCETPKCSSSLFVREDDRPYLEVHHIVPLGEGGDDTLINAAALCPSCHRELHFGKLRLRKRALLTAEIIRKSTP
jgi:5-methylcytosine-specific restriction endonuclease McrA